MYQLANESNIQELFTYFEKDLKNCLYSYIDLKKYGIHNKDLQIYFNKNQDQITSVATKYYNGLQLFHYGSVFPVNNTIALIHDLQPSIISSTPDIIDALATFTLEYEVEQGFVTSLENVKTDFSYSVTPACLADMEDIAKLICMDEGLGGHYTVPELKEQLATRKKEKFGRNYIIREKGNIVCHAATYAEVDNLAVISGVITHPNYRGHGYARSLVAKLCADLLSEGKRPYLFYYTKESEALYKKIGFQSPSGWAKLVKH